MLKCAHACARPPAHLGARVEGVVDRVGVDASGLLRIVDAEALAAADLHEQVVVLVKVQDRVLAITNLRLFNLDLSLSDMQKWVYNELK